MAAEFSCVRIEAAASRRFVEEFIVDDEAHINSLFFSKRQHEAKQPIPIADDSGTSSHAPAMPAALMTGALTINTMVVRVP